MSFAYKECGLAFLFFKMEIKKNRQRIYDLLLLMSSVEDKDSSMSNQLEQEIREASKSRQRAILCNLLNFYIGSWQAQSPFLLKLS